MTQIVDLESIENNAVGTRQDQIAERNDLAIFPEIWIAAGAAFTGVTDYLIMNIDGFAAAAGISVRRSQIDHLMIAPEEA